MKFLTLILLVISVAATLVPCCAFDECRSEVENTKRDEKNQEGSCSPFSTCPTCAACVIVTRTLQIAEPEIKKVSVYQGTFDIVLPSYSPSCWQPPRLS